MRLRFGSFLLLLLATLGFIIAGRSAHDGVRMSISLLYFVLLLPGFRFGRGLRRRLGLDLGIGDAEQALQGKGRILVCGHDLSSACMCTGACVRARIGSLIASGDPWAFGFDASFFNADHGASVVR